MARPTDAHRRGTGGILEHEVPTDDPGDDLTHGGVRVGICAARDGHSGSHFGVTETGERASNADDSHRDHHGVPRVERRGLTGQHEDAGTDDGADAEGDQIQGAERPFELVLARRIGLGA